LLVTLTQFRPEQLLFLLRVVSQTGLSSAGTRLGLTFPFLLTDSQLGTPLLLQLGLARFGFDGQLLLALLQTLFLLLKPCFEAQRHFLLALLHAMFEILLAVTQRLLELKLLPFKTVLLLARELLHLAR
jgi:hypothetical protein